MARGGRRTNNSLVADVKKLETLFERNRSGNSYGLNDELLSNKMPIHFGGMSDPFDSPSTTRISIDFLKILKKNNYPTVLSTKNTAALLKPEVLELIVGNDNIIVQVSLTAYSEKITQKLEPNVPSSEKRILAIKQLKKLGLPIVIRLQPIIPSLLDDIYNFLIPCLNETQIDHIIFEHLKLPVEKNISLIKEFETSLNSNIYEMFKKLNSKLVGREWLLPIEVKYSNLRYLISRLHSSITYSLADYGLQHLGETSCCCGIDKFWHNSDWFKGNIVNCIKDNLELDSFGIELLENYSYPISSISRIMNSHSRLSHKNSIKDYLKQKWNLPGTINAPDHLLGIKYFKKDMNGNCLYIKDNLWNHMTHRLRN